MKKKFKNTNFIIFTKISLFHFSESKKYFYFFIFLSFEWGIFCNNSKTRNLVDLARYICYFKRLSHASVSMRISYILDCEQLIIKVIIYLNVED
jgi:hypothetical protein